MASPSATSLVNTVIPIVNLTEDEQVALVFDGEGVEEGLTEASLCLVGTLWTDRPFNVQAFMRTMKMVWKPSHDVEISQLDKNLFIFQFHHWRDKERVMEQEPWNFDNQVVLLREIKGDEQPSDLDIHQSWSLPSPGSGENFESWKVYPFLGGEGCQAAVATGFHGHVAKDCTHVADDDLLNLALYQYGKELRASPLHRPSVMQPDNPIDKVRRKLVFKSVGTPSGVVREKMCTGQEERSTIGMPVAYSLKASGHKDIEVSEVIHTFGCGGEVYVQQQPIGT
ncbi:hypothetical protein Tsubulata_042147 [Turnera subulata]|uniref:DUF4283 domain-containing protein n=1 Tax=Turnera subulata TaxID=218843 RepID=A0A9Q0J7W9_9ROSI|nr:hypothetical protein Tsubulata_042147 [Turnera subulata]